MSPANATIAALLVAGLASLPARSEDIESVLFRSQALRLAAMPALADHLDAVRTLKLDFTRVVERAGLAPTQVPALHVVAGGTVAETVQGSIIVVNVALAEWPELARRFVLAHEIAHVRAGHWDERVQLYRRLIPGEVGQAKTDAVAAELGIAASRQSHVHEHAADEFAINLMLDLGFSEDELLSAFMHMGHHRATATHPGMGQRVGHLRSLAMRRLGMVSNRP